MLMFSVLFSASSFARAEDLSLVLSAEKNLYRQEEEIFFSLTIRNISDETSHIEIEYLQPEKNQTIFIGKGFQLTVETQEGAVEFFTNEMPPEPRPGSLDVKMEAGEKTTWKIFFPYYYYPLKLPNTFKVKARYKGFVSNEVVVAVKEPEGKIKEGNFIINPDFSEGEHQPYGWKILNEKTFWEKERGRLVFSLDEKTAYGEGVWVYSLFYAIETPVELNLDIAVKSAAPEVNVFVEGWGMAGGRRRCLERNELFVHPDNTMKDYTFKVVFNMPEVEWFRIKLFSYLRPGLVWFDSVNLALPKKGER